MLIRNAEIDGQLLDLHIDGSHIAEIGTALPASVDESVIDAAGAALLPGLHDHHIHLRALAAARASVRCDTTQVAEVLRAADTRLDAGAWLRGVGYHESICGELDREALDALLPHRPLRIQHRSGRLWIFNSAAIERLAPESDAPLDVRRGHLLDADDWLRARLRGQPPSLHAISRELASYGVTGVTDTTHHNGPHVLEEFATAQARGELLQTVRVMGDARLDEVGSRDGAQRGEHKFHLHEHALPELDILVAAIRRSHARDRGCAFHCVTRTELVFALAALREAGVRGDRIEHAAVAPPELVADIAALGLTVITQPGFIAERGDDYLREVEAADRPWLYRLRGFVDAGVPLALSTDAPFTEPDPWRAMQAAIDRRSAGGATLGSAEALEASQALSAFLAPLDSPGAVPRRIVVGAPADLCLLDRSLDAVLAQPAAARVRQCWCRGRAVLPDA